MPATTGSRSNFQSVVSSYWITSLMLKSSERLGGVFKLDLRSSIKPGLRKRYNHAPPMTVRTKTTTQNHLLLRILFSIQFDGNKKAGQKEKPLGFGKQSGFRSGVPRSSECRRSIQQDWRPIRCRRGGERLVSSSPSQLPALLGRLCPEFLLAGRFGLGHRVEKRDLFLPDPASLRLGGLARERGFMTADRADRLGNSQGVGPHSPAVELVLKGGSAFLLASEDLHGISPFAPWGKILLLTYSLSRK